MKYQCLIVDDEKELADSTMEYFNIFGVQTIAVYGAAECRQFLEKNTVDLILLDINLRDGSGFDLCQDLRKTMNIPILFISARTADDDKIIALNIGGDDYIQKPYSLGVLLAKVKVVLKRYGKASKIEYTDGNLTVHFESRQVIVRGSIVKLTTLEFKLLVYLIENEGKIVTKQEIFNNVWEDKFTSDGTLNVHIRRLREAIEINPNEPQYIQTIWGDGYQFVGGKR